MRKIDVGIYLKNKQHTEDMAKALAEFSPRLNITEMEYRTRYLQDGTEEFDVVVTDREGFEEYNPKVLLIEGRGILEHDKEYEKQGQTVGLYATASEILAGIIRIYERNMQIPFTPQKDGRVKVLSFFSLTGGSGVSAAAVTVGRQICMNAGKKVLYMNAGGTDSWKLYITDANKAARPSRELSHLIQNHAVYSIDSYVATDRFGLRYLDRIEKPEIVLKALHEAGDYDIILVDMPHAFLHMDFDRIYLVQNDKDLRGRIAMPKELEFNNAKFVTRLINRSPAAGREEGRINIPEDGRSFNIIDNGINIAMDGDYAMNLRKVSEEWI